MPTINNDKLKEFKDNLIQLSEGITKQDFVKSFKHLLKIVTRIEQELIKKINQALINLNDDYKALKNATQSSLSDFTAKYGQSLDKALKEQESALNFIRDKVRKIENGLDGETPIKGVDYFDGEKGDDGSPDTPEEIKRKLDIALEDDLFDIEDIENLEERLKNLEERPLGRVGGGTSKLAVDLHFIDDETPTNSGDDLTFTIARTPSPTSSFKLYRGGARQQVNPSGTTDGDYSLSGTTFTLNVALVTSEILLCDYKI